MKTAHEQELSVINEPSQYATREDGGKLAIIWRNAFWATCGRSAASCFDSGNDKGLMLIFNPRGASIVAVIFIGVAEGRWMMSHQ